MRRAALAATLCIASALPRPCRAESGDFERMRGQMHARAGRCDEAIVDLEKAEAVAHRPSAAEVLAGCHEKLGHLLEAHAIYARMANEPAARRRWDFYDLAAHKRAGPNAERLDARIPTLAITPAGAYEGLIVEVDGEARDLEAPLRFDPPAKVSITATAAGHQPFETTVTLAIGARETLELRLVRIEPTEKPPPRVTPRPKPRRKPAPPPPKIEDPSWWLGARFVGLILPRFLMNTIGEGGADVFIPGGGLTATIPTSGPELIFSLAYAYYGLGGTPFKVNDTPDTEYEIIESDLMSLAASMDVMWSFPLDAREHVSFRIGGSIGVGWTFYGDLFRTQAYPVSLTPGHPHAYIKCDGPNEPAGSFRYCNQLDKDADHYDGFSEPSWFEGGARPLIYPWGALQLGLGFKPTRRLLIDVEGGYSVVGFLTSVGFRYGI